MAAQGPPPPPSSGSSPNTAMIRNIITGVVTTVLGATVIYFLGFHKSGDGVSPAENMLVTKEATINAWKSYVYSENIFWGNFKIYGDNYTEAGFDDYKTNTLNELARFNTDIKKILESKDLDPSLVSLLERRIESKEQWGIKYRKHLDSYERVSKSTTDPQEKTAKLNEQVSDFQNDVKELDQKFANEIGEMCNALSTKYNYNFLWSELKMYQPIANNNNTTNNNGTNAGNSSNTTIIDWRKLVGKWRTSDNTRQVGTLYQYDDGRMYYYFDTGDSAYGRWQVSNNQLTLFYDRYFGQGYNYVYNLSDVTDNSFTITYTMSPYNSFSAVRSTY